MQARNYKLWLQYTHQLALASARTSLRVVPQRFIVHPLQTKSISIQHTVHTQHCARALRVGRMRVVTLYEWLNELVKIKHHHQKRKTQRDTQVTHTLMTCTAATVTRREPNGCNLKCV